MAGIALQQRTEKSTALLAAAFTNATVQPRRDRRCPECTKSVDGNPVGQEENTIVPGEEAGINESGETEESLSEKVTSWLHLTLPHTYIIMRQSMMSRYLAITNLSIVISRRFSRGYQQVNQNASYAE